MSWAELTPTQKAIAIGLALLALVLVAFASREHIHIQTETQLTQALTQSNLKAEVATNEARSLREQVQQLTVTLKQKVEEIKLALHREATTHTEQRPDGTIITDSHSSTDLDKDTTRQQLEQAASLMVALKDERDLARSQATTALAQVQTLKQELASRTEDITKSSPAVAILVGWQFATNAGTVNPWDKARVGAGLPWGPLTVGVDCAPLSVLNGSGFSALDPQLRVELRL